MNKQVHSDELSHPPGLEDWTGSQLDKRPTVSFTRAYNGVIVRSYDLSRDCYGDMLVFQDMEKLIDWLQVWHASTAVQR